MAAGGMLASAVPGGADQTMIRRSPAARLPMVALGLPGSTKTVLPSKLTVIGDEVVGAAPPP